MMKNIIGDQSLYSKHRCHAHSIWNLKYNTPKEITVIFNNGSNYDDHFIIKELVEEFEEQFTCLQQNTEKYIIFSILIKKKLKKLVKRKKKRN